MMKPLTEEMVDEYTMEAIISGRGFVWTNWVESIFFDRGIEWQKYLVGYAQMRKAGLHPDNVADVIRDFEFVLKNGGSPQGLGCVVHRYDLQNITAADEAAVATQIRARAVRAEERCWHPQAGPSTCAMKKGRPDIINAHSLQNAKVISLIGDDGNVVWMNKATGELDGSITGRSKASTFRGMCKTHDAVFNPIEVEDYTGTDEQHFLFAYRANLYSMHVKWEMRHQRDFGPEWESDEDQTKNIFDQALLTSQWDVIETQAFILPRRYPLAATGKFYLELDFMENRLALGHKRREFVYVTLLPRVSETVFLFSYLKQDHALYRPVGEQMRSRYSLTSDISAMLASHVENMYFNPRYFEQFICPQAKRIKAAKDEVNAVGMGLTIYGGPDQQPLEVSFTREDYLLNPFGVQLFHEHSIDPQTT
jgi:hypothetical protein